MKHIVRLVVAALFLVSLPAYSQLPPPMHWNMVGSTTTLDETSAPHAYTDMSLHFGGAALGSIVARYPVTNVFGSGITTVPPWSILEVAHTDNGPNAFVSATLFEVNRCTRVRVPLCTINSLDGPAGTVCQRCTWATPTDFGQNIYYVEVRLSRNNVAGIPSVESLSIY